MGDPLFIVIVVGAAIGLLLLAFGSRRRRPGRSDPEVAIEQAIFEAERDRQKTEALEAAEITKHQYPPGGGF